MAISQRLKYARDRSGLTLKQVEERSGVGESSLSEFENGKREPKVSQLAVLAEVYHRSISFLLGDSPPEDDPVLWRERPESPTADELAARFRQLAEQYHNLEVWTGECAISPLMQVDAEAGRFGYREAQELARAVRNELQLGDRPALSLLRLLEDVWRVKVYHLPFEPRGCAACCFGELFGPAVLLNANHVRWRRNFDLAHELFHLVTWRMFARARGPDRDTPDAQEEQLATCFAAHLLMPTDPIRSALEAARKDDRWSFPDLADVAILFDVSVEALLWRMKYIFNREVEQTRKDIERYNVVCQGRHERESDTPPALPLRYRLLAERALREGHLSVGQFAKYVNISRRAAMRIAEQEVPDDETVEAVPA